MGVILRILFLILSALVVAACAAQEVLPTSPDYPAITKAQRIRILGALPSYGREALRVTDHLSDVVIKAEHRQPLTQQEAAGMRLILQRLDAEQARTDAYNNKMAAEAHEKAERQRELLDARQEVIDRENAERAEVAMAQQGSAFRRDFEDISRPDDAQRFLATYRNQPDPDGLLPKAESRGYSQGVLTSQKCIKHAHEIIAQQNAIAAEVGYVDKSLMYRAGQALVSCKKNLGEWQKMVRKG